MIKFSWNKIIRHSLVRKSSPDDPSLKEYSEKQNKKSDKTEADFNKKQSSYIAGKQDFKCPVCGQTLFNNEPLHLYHIIHKNRGKDEVNNLVWLHLHCHHKTYYQKQE